MFIKNIKRAVIVILVIFLIVGTMSIRVYAETDSKINIASVISSESMANGNERVFDWLTDRSEKNNIASFLDNVLCLHKANGSLQEWRLPSYLFFTDKESVDVGYATVCNEHVNVKRGPSTRCQSVCLLNDGDVVYIIGIIGGWYEIVCKDVVGYVRMDNVKLTEIPYEDHELFFKKGRSVTTRIDTSLIETNRIDVNEENKMEHVEDEQQIEPVTSVVPETEKENQQSGEFGNNVLNIAEQYLGIPYRSGGTTPSGFDCSGFVYYVFNKAGYSLSRSMFEQYEAGSPVSKNDLKPGDIVFFKDTYKKGMSHVGIYAGDGQFIHSPRTGKVVSYSDLYSDYWIKHYYGACRILK